ncbi:hypothetical protein M413DRAFT_11356 [Hebeloma cylindrosporum]|uniref:Uncharacterized protein n=1 Tax=Hebeloma cylindrosporum TaxID=76867 RepID=A0A0C3CAG1_HEBCY|nr:hypothetical protein M413DRAFT_11356 [Hebeloma cylindrosporum h7]
MQNVSALEASLQEVRERLRRQGGGGFIPPYSHFPVQATWHPHFYMPQGTFTQASTTQPIFPAATPMPSSGYVLNPGLPNVNIPVQPQNLWQNSLSLGQRPQPLPHYTPSAYNSGASSLHANNQFNPSLPSSTPHNNIARALQPERINLLSSGRPIWDIRLHPAAARSGGSSVLNLDLPLLPLGVVSAEILFANRRMSHFGDTWGPIHVRKDFNRSDATGGISNSLSFRDIFENIYRYFMMPLNDQERAQFMPTPQHHIEASAAFTARNKVQGFDYDFYRRVDLLPNGLSNFDGVEFVQSFGPNSCFLQLRLH